MPEMIPIDGRRDMQVELYVTAGPAKGKHFIFEKPDSFLFGRAADAHISLPQDRYVSRQHFLLEISPPRCKLRDLNSKNGVIVNGVLYGGKAPSDEGIKRAPNGQKEVLLQHGDEIIVGDTRIKVFIRSTPVKKQALPVTHQPHRSVLICQKCGKEVRQIDERKTQNSSDYICDACREKEHREELRNILENASNQDVHQPIDQIQSVDLDIPGYQLEYELKHTGTGKIYKAVHKESGESVAIKLLLPQGSVDPYMVRAFHRELAIIHQLKHPNLVRFIEHGESSGIFYFVFEFIEGYDLPKYIQSKGGRLSLDDAAPLWFGILDGLAYAHRVTLTLKNSKGQQKTVRGIVHRNLKPQNILLVHHGDGWLPKITDFGLAKSFESAGFTDITVPGDVLGTPVYWPREQITHYRYLNPATDVFAIAAVFYEMLTGSWVREGFEELFNKCKQLGRLPSISDYMLLISNNPPIPLRQKDPTIPKPIAQVIDQALKEQEIPHDVEQMHTMLQTLRYADAGTFRDALVQAFQEIGLPGAVKAQVSSKTPAVAYENNHELLLERNSKKPSQSIMYSVIHNSSKQEVALFLLDIVGSTKFVINSGDTDFSTLMGSLFRRVRKHPSSSKLILLKSTGDGFLAVYKSMSAAFALARTYLEQPTQADIHVRMALHWGVVNTGPDGDVLGTEVRRIFRVENIQKEDCLDPTSLADTTFSITDRIVATEAAIDRLSEAERALFHSIGTFQLSTSKDTGCDLWVWQLQAQ